MYTHTYTVPSPPKTAYQSYAVPQEKATYLPSRVLDVDRVRQSLGLMHLSSENVSSYILSAAQEALIRGQGQRVNYAGQSYVQVAHQQMVFTLSSDCTTVVATQWRTTSTTSFAQHLSQQTMKVKATAIPRAVSPESTASPESIDEIVDQIKDEMDKFIMDDDSSHFQRSRSTSPCTSVSCAPPSPTPSIQRSFSNSSHCTSVSAMSWTPCSSKGTPRRSGLSKLSGLAPPPPLTCILSAEELDVDDPSLKLMGSKLTKHESLNVDVPAIISDSLYRDLSTRFPGIWESKAHCAQMVHSIISQQPGDRVHHVMWWRVWSCTPFVVITESDGSTLADIFEERYFKSHYQHCMQSLAQRYASKPVVHSKYPMSTPSSTPSSLSMQQSPVPMAADRDPQRYHLIYIKPIMERLAKVTGCSPVTESNVIEIVDGAIRCGSKRQISKRTFAFQWERYTVIMSKSLKTILDVAVKGNGDRNGNGGGVRGEVVTVHPDVVSILAKKCPDLDYFTIQKLADSAKRTGRFSVKKNDYRKQYRYEFAGCHIVFASNHSTIVEMQCVDHNALSLWSSVGISTC